MFYSWICCGAMWNGSCFTIENDVQVDVLTVVDYISYLINFHLQFTNKSVGSLYHHDPFLSNAELHWLATVFEVFFEAFTLWFSQLYFPSQKNRTCTKLTKSNTQPLYKEIVEAMGFFPSFIHRLSRFFWLLWRKWQRSNNNSQKTD